MYAWRVDAGRDSGVGNGSSAKAASVKDIGTEGAGAESTSAKGAGIRDAGIRDAGIGDAEIGDAEIGDAGIGDAEIRDAGLEDACAANARGTGDDGPLKDLGIHLQWSRILEVRLFGTRLETWIGACCIESACIGQTLELRDAGLEVRVEAIWFSLGLYWGSYAFGGPYLGW